MISPYKLTYRILRPVIDAYGNYNLFAAISEFIDDYEKAKDRMYEVLQDYGAVILEAVIVGPKDIIMCDRDRQTNISEDGSVLCSYRIMQMQKVKRSVYEA